MPIFARLFVLIVGTIASVNTPAQVTYDGNGTSVVDIAGNSSVTISNFQVPAGDDRYIVVTLDYVLPPLTNATLTVTYDGANMFHAVTANRDGEYLARIYYLNLGSGAAESGDVVAQLNTFPTSMRMGAATFQNVGLLVNATGDTAENTGTGVNAVGLQVATVPDNMVVDVIQVEGSDSIDLTPGGSQIILNETGFPVRHAASIRAPTANPTSMNWSFNESADFAHAAVDLVCRCNEDVVIEGTTGDDVLEGKNGDDTLTGKAGHDLLLGYWGKDWLIGDLLDLTASGKDVLDGGPGDDILNGGPGSDVLKGGDGDDVLEPGPGDNCVVGGTGFNTLKMDYLSLLRASRESEEGHQAPDLIDGFTITAEPELVNGFRITIQQPGLSTDLNDQIGECSDFEDSPDPEVADTYAKDIHQVIGSVYGDWFEAGPWGGTIFDAGGGADVLKGNIGTDTLKGGGGNDTIYPSLGDDTVEGGEGFDTVIVNTDLLDNQKEAKTFYQTTLLTLQNFVEMRMEITNRVNARQDQRGQPVRGEVTMYFQEYTDVEKIVGTDFDDVYVGSEIIDNFDGAGGNDTMSGAEGEDIFEGGPGNDRIDGGTDDDMMSGGSGGDRYLLALADLAGHDTIVETSGLDRLRLTDFGLDQISSAEQSAGALVLHFTAGGSVTITDHFTNADAAMERLETPGCSYPLSRDAGFVSGAVETLLGHCILFDDYFE